MSSLSGHKRTFAELSGEIYLFDGWSDLYLAHREIDSLRKQLAEKTEENTNLKKTLADIHDEYDKKIDEIDAIKRNAITKKTKYDEVMTENAMKNDEIFQLHRELLFYKSVNPGNKEFDPTFFDDSSAAWKANKTSKGNGEYEYKKKPPTK